MQALKVLVADDEIGMRKGVQKVLKKAHFKLEKLDHEIRFEILEAEDGRQTIELLQKEPIDLLLLDYKMPEVSGLEVLEWIKKEKRDVTTIMITAYASLDVAVSATKNGAFDFLAKPFTPEELRTVVEKATRNLIAQREAKRLAEEKRKIRFQFLSVLAHELKAPIAAVESYLRLMQGRAAGEELKNYDHIISRSLIRLEGMRKLIFDLLDLTRIESGEKKRELRTIDLVPIAKNSIETLSVLASERDIEITLKAPESLKLTADHSELEIILNNLISNAIKYNKDHGKVEVILKESDSQVIIQVSDTGIGMTPEEQSRLFQEFVRIKNEQTRNVLGSGLGLSIVKKIAQLYNGTVSVKSEKNVGSTFTVALPIQQEQQVKE
ncbi:response regulator receiver sensor signal transduction histidine kinase [Caldithrix abyssi DSM 13497]|uniref:histidine kinase n=1 Tax=Caldithrix abyssi DSM 13497 TaxID=880073 RepID=H1XPR9_CALAY|nr:hybrid sensor histidine kinase/response regulator [Caldithrix abyssi]APF20427.1 Signal transduction histidine kinase [Caldithrix abyssi DSM 13497]EHO41045.1 response regulator receiver sensor signal transduction histidine kinase [Caldithrix abyssi DSM 13497]